MALTGVREVRERMTTEVMLGLTCCFLLPTPPLQAVWSLLQLTHAIRKPHLANAPRCESPLSSWRRSALAGLTLAGLGSRLGHCGRPPETGMCPRWKETPRDTAWTAASALESWTSTLTIPSTVQVPRLRPASSPAQESLTLACLLPDGFVSY